MTICVGGFLIVLSVQDIRYKKISFVGVMVSILLGIAYSLQNRRGIVALCDVLPGSGLCMIAALTSGAIGVGDGLVAIFYGLVFGWRQTCIWLLLAFLLASFAGIFMCMRGKRCRLQIPFIPFLTIVHMGMCL